MRSFVLYYMSINLGNKSMQYCLVVSEQQQPTVLDPDKRYPSGRELVPGW